MIWSSVRLTSRADSAAAKLYFHHAFHCASTPVFTSACNSQGTFLFEKLPGEGKKKDHFPECVTHEDLQIVPENPRKLELIKLTFLGKTPNTYVYNFRAEIFC